jgi:hypothetical protein
LFRHLLLQIGGANIENPPPSTSLAAMFRHEEMRAEPVEAPFDRLRAQATDETSGC